MTTILRVNLGDNDVLANEAIEAIKESGIKIQLPRRNRGSISPEAIQVIIALGSAGAFTALYQVIGTLLERNKGWEIQIENKNEKKVTIKGPTLVGVKELLQHLAPELIEGKKQANRRLK